MEGLPLLLLLLLTWLPESTCLPVRKKPLGDMSTYLGGSDLPRGPSYCYVGWGPPKASDSVCFLLRGVVPPPGNPMSPAPGLCCCMPSALRRRVPRQRTPRHPPRFFVLVYLPLLGIMFPINGPQVTGEIGASVPRPLCHSFVCPPLTSGSGVVFVKRLTTIPHPDAVSHARALATTAEGRGARNTSPASRPIPF